MTTTAPAGPISAFANAAARDSQIEAPAIGQGVFLVDSGSVLFYYGPSLGWLPEWNQPWGEQGRYAEITTASATINAPAAPTTIAGLSVVVNPVAGRQYMAEFDGSVVSNANGDLIVVYIDTSHAEIAGCGTSLLHFASASQAITLAGTAPDVLRFSKRWVSTDNSQHTFTVSAGQLTGSLGQVYGNACQSSALRVVDIGPAANPIYR